VLNEVKDQVPTDLQGSKGAAPRPRALAPG